MTSTNTKPEVVLSVRGSHLEKSIGRHISIVVVDPEWHYNNGDEVKIKTELDAGMWRYHDNRMDARRSQFDLGRVDAYI